MGRGRPGTGVQALSSNIRVRFTWAGRRCSEYLDLAPTPANIKAAERLMARLHHEIEYDLFDYARTFPNSEFARAEAERQAEAEQQALAEREAETTYFCDFADRWLASLTVEKSTYSCYLGAIEEVWKPHFRDRPIGSIRPSEIKAIVAELAKRVTGKTVNNSLIPLRGVFAAALDDEIIDRAPTLNIKNLKHQSPKPDPFRAEEMEAIIASLYDRYDPQVAHWYEFAFGTGLRPSEQIVVRWGDIDWNGGAIRIERARVRAVVKSTKTSSIRDVDLTDRTLGVLDRQRSFSFMKGADAPIFENPSSRLPWPDVQDQRKLYFHPTLLRLGLRKRDAYQTRHTFATLALMAGVNPAYIARQLGHANTAMLFKHYSKWIDGADAGREKSKLNGVFGPKLDQKVSILPGISQPFGVLGSTKVLRNREKRAGDPYGTRTRVFAVRGRRPRPLDEGAVKRRPALYGRAGPPSTQKMQLRPRGVPAPSFPGSPCRRAGRRAPATGRH